jgi:hypothetical protein
MPCTSFLCTLILMNGISEQLTLPKAEIFFRAIPFLPVAFVTQSL